MVNRHKASEGGSPPPSARAPRRPGKKKSSPRGPEQSLREYAEHGRKKAVMLSFRFDRETVQWLRSAAACTGIPGSRIVRAALRRELARLEKSYGQRFPT